MISMIIYDRRIIMKRTNWFDKKRFVIMMTGIVGIGIFLSFLLEVNYGTDTCAFMNASLSRCFGISFGTTMVLTNLLFFIPELIWGRKLIGPGTIANMMLIGYISDFCRMPEETYLPSLIFQDPLFRTLIFLAALIPFLISVALYMNADMGQVPYDSIATIISERLHLPFAPVRIFWDCLIILVGVLAGGHLTIGTVVLAFSIGPAVTVIGKKMKALF